MLLFLNWFGSLLATSLEMPDYGGGPMPPWPPK